MDTHQRQVDVSVNVELYNQVGQKGIHQWHCEIHCMVHNYLLWDTHRNKLLLLFSAFCSIMWLKALNCRHESIFITISCYHQANALYSLMWSGRYRRKRAAVWSFCFTVYLWSIVRHKILWNSAVINQKVHLNCCVVKTHVSWSRTNL